MIRSIIIDNDLESISRLQTTIEMISDIEVNYVFNNPFDALKPFLEEDIDVVFIEPSLPGFDGFSFIKNIPSNIKVVVISNVKEYAVEAFEIEALDFLVKPVVQNRLVKTISRILKNNVNEDVLKVRSHFFVKVDKKMVKIYHDQILFVEAVGDYVKIVCKDDTFISASSLKRFTAELPEDSFIRVHRSYTISPYRVTALEGNTIEIGKHKIPVGRQYLNEVRSRIMDS